MEKATEKKKLTTPVWWCLVGVCIILVTTADSNQLTHPAAMHKTPYISSLTGKQVGNDQIEVTCKTHPKGHASVTIILEEISESKEKIFKTALLPVALPFSYYSAKFQVSPRQGQHQLKFKISCQLVNNGGQATKESYMCFGDCKDTQEESSNIYLFVGGCIILILLLAAYCIFKRVSSGDE